MLPSFEKEVKIKETQLLPRKPSFFSVVSPIMLCSSSLGSAAERGLDELSTPTPSSQYHLYPLKSQTLRFNNPKHLDSTTRTGAQTHPSAVRSGDIWRIKGQRAVSLLQRFPLSRCSGQSLHSHPGKNGKNFKPPVWGAEGARSLMQDWVLSDFPSRESIPLPSSPRRGC